MKAVVPFQGSSGLTAEAYLLTHLKLREKLFIAFTLLGALFFGCAHGPHDKTSGLEVLSMCGGFYTQKALTGPKADIVIQQVDTFLDECRKAAPDHVCSRYACMITNSTESKMTNDVQGQSWTGNGTSFPIRRPRRLSQDPVNLTLTLYTPELHWELQMVQEAPEPGHQLEPDRNWDVKEKCRQQCHIKHCQSWNACNATTGTDRSDCEGRVNDDEKRCMNSCGST